MKTGTNDEKLTRQEGRNWEISEGSGRNKLGLGGSPSEVKRTRRGVAGGRAPCIRKFLEFAFFGFRFAFY